MGTRRRSDGEHPAWDAGARGPEGRPLCRRCLAEILPGIGAGEFCGPACRHEFLVHASPAYARRAVFARDRGVCSHCRLPCGRLDRVIALVAGTAGDPEEGRARALALIEALGFGARQRVVSLWQADHRLAVAEGGGDCGLGNYRTLCLACHASETRDLHLRLRRRRRAADPTPRWSA